MLDNLGKKVITDVAISLARDNFPGLASNLASNIINKFERKINGKGAARARKGFNLFTSNEDMSGIIKITKSLEDSNVLIDGITETVKHEIKKQEGRFLPALLAPLTPLLVQPVILKYFNYRPRFNGVFPRNNLPKIKDGAYIVNLDGTRWVSLFIDRNIVACFDSFGIEYILQEVLNKITDKSITNDIIRIQDNDSIMYGFCCMAFIEYMLAGKALLLKLYWFIFSKWMGKEWQNNI